MIAKTMRKAEGGAKRLATALLALVMALAMSVPATALADETTYSITINSAADGETYSAYKVFDVTNSGENYAYTIDSSSLFYGVVSAASDIFTLTQVGNSTTYVVTYDKNVSAESILNVLSGATLPTNEDGSAKADGSAVAENDTAVISLGEAGYYYVTTTLGSVVALDNAAPTATITDKNGEPTPDKKVLEGEDYGKTSDASVGDTVTFQTTITDIKGAENLVLHDTMTNLNFASVSSVTVKLNGASEATELGSSDYSVVTESLNDGCAFHVVFSEDFLKTLTSDGEIVVTYTATVAASAATAEDGATNKASVSYGNAGTSSSTTSETKTYTYDLDIFKYTGTNTPLAGAKFVLSKDVSGTTYYAVVSGGVLSRWSTTESDATELTSGSDGNISVKGLDAGSYVLTETEAPAGYNKLTSPIEVTIAGTVDAATGKLTGDYTVSVTSSNASTPTGGNTIQVQNNTGTALPGTGGMGTTVFYVVGGVLVIGAVLLLVTRRRMARSEQ